MAKWAQKGSSWQTLVGGGGRKRRGWAPGRVGVPSPKEGVPWWGERKVGGRVSRVFGEVNSGCGWFRALAEFSIHSFSSFCTFVSYPHALCRVLGPQEKADQALSWLGQTGKSFRVPGLLTEVVSGAMGTQSRAELEVEGQGGKVLEG